MKLKNILFAQRLSRNVIFSDRNHAKVSLVSEFMKFRRVFYWKKKGKNHAKSLRVRSPFTSTAFGRCLCSCFYFLLIVLEPVGGGTSFPQRPSPSLCPHCSSAEPLGWFTTAQGAPPAAGGRGPTSLAFYLFAKEKDLEALLISVEMLAFLCFRSVLPVAGSMGNFNAWKNPKHLGHFAKVAQTTGKTRS